jgi:hypothetical protein
MLTVHTEPLLPHAAPQRHRRHRACMGSDFECPGEMQWLFGYRVNTLEDCVSEAAVTGVIFTGSGVQHPMLNSHWQAVNLQACTPGCVVCWDLLWCDTANELEFCISARNQLQQVVVVCGSPLLVVEHSSMARTAAAEWSSLRALPLLGWCCCW